MIRRIRQAQIQAGEDMVIADLKAKGLLAKHTTTGQSLGTLLKQFGLTKSALSRLRLGKSWKNLSSDQPEKFATPVA